MAWNEKRGRIPTAGIGDGATGAGVSDFFRQFTI
jgi:hypothetical protein